MVHTENGERSFSYWRNESVARLLATDREFLRSAFERADIIVFSGITLAIIEDEGAENLLPELGDAKAADKLVAFDTNIRPSLWPDTAKIEGVVSRLFRTFD